MRARIVMLAAVVLLPHSTTARCSPPPAASKSEDRFIIRLAPRAEWRAKRADVRKVLHSVAEELRVFFPERNFAPILVTNSDGVEPEGGPIVLFRRGPGGEYLVRLKTGNLYWSQYAFQFAHEFCHILCNYRDADRQIKWFEETLCETASLFVLRRMAETWKTDPPYENWKKYAPALRKYADQRLQARRLPGDTTLADYYASHADRLRDNPISRDINRVIAGELLPLFEQQPRHWEAVSWLNHGEPDRDCTFREYLSRWHDHSPERHKPFIRRIARQFGIVVSDRPAP